MSSETNKTTSRPGHWSIPEVARLFAIGEDKVRGWVRRGELLAENVAERIGDRPLWRIADEELQRFRSARRSIPETTTKTRKQSCAAGAAGVFFRNGRRVRRAAYQTSAAKSTENTSN
jgi:hypothetical protein